MKNKKSILIVGAKSQISSACAYEFASKGFDIFLVARNKSDIESLKSDLEIKFNIDVWIYTLDLLDIEKFNSFADNLNILPDIMLCSVGLLSDQKQCEEDILNASLVIRSNFDGPALFTEAISRRFIDRGHGTIIGISSVAGERGRQSNYFYGSAKSGFTAYLSGLRNRFSNTNINVMTVIPGYVNTKMIQGMNLPKFLISEPVDLARKIFISYKKKKSIIYSSYKWRFIMIIIKLIPERIFSKLKL